MLNFENNTLNIEGLPHFESVEGHSVDSKYLKVLRILYVFWFVFLMGALFIAFIFTKLSLPLFFLALGTLTLTVMARGRTFRVLRDCNAKPFIYLLPLLISFAAVLRLNAIQLGYSSSLMLSTLCWSLAFTGLFIWLLWLAKVKSAQ